ncbi:hypothetical protein BDV39DRAFT_187222 [Aspergillus sergii]|uniref:Uncharacterized protein n=1 Tax=Aspergillus sergii TaxID=1034303 RepID=A0A5N6WJN6_9EURO|nr:hypothetical protein BDV39DRAFT_187222 [Aspergillus sergii]
MLSSMGFLPRSRGCMMMIRKVVFMGMIPTMNMRVNLTMNPWNMTRRRAMGRM